MQSRAIMEAACQLNKEGLKVVPEIMIPLVGLVKEFKDQKAIVEKVAQDVMKEQGIKIKYLVGTMIEVPRGAITADEIAAEAQFFSFGTNDLTQMTFGFSRDDAGKFLKIYQEKRILDADPFASIDTVGVGKLVAMACELGRKHPPGPQAGRLRRARRRPGVHSLLPEGRPELRELLAVPRAGRAAGGGAGGDVGQGRGLATVSRSHGPAVGDSPTVVDPWQSSSQGVSPESDRARGTVNRLSCPLSMHTKTAKS